MENVLIYLIGKKYIDVNNFIYTFGHKYDIHTQRITSLINLIRMVLNQVIIYCRYLNNTYVKVNEVEDGYHTLGTS